MKYKLYIEYDGTNYSGWQAQENTPRTIEGKLREALSKVITGEYQFQGAGRTDAGVHALGQVAHLDADVKISPDSIRTKVNHFLPKDICIYHAAAAPPDFHARHDALARSYLYQISHRRTVFAHRCSHHLKHELDMRQVKELCRLLAGFKDYRSFTRDDPEEKSTQVFVESMEAKEVGNLLLIRIVGSHFLWRMARQMIGVLLEVGRGRMTLEQVGELFSSSSPIPAQLTAPAAGLFLERVYYQGEPRAKEIHPVVSVR